MFLVGCKLNVFLYKFRQCVINSYRDLLKMCLSYEMCLYSVILFLNKHVCSTEIWMSWALGEKYHRAAHDTVNGLLIKLSLIHMIVSV